MPTLITRTANYLRNAGVRATLRRVAQYPKAMYLEKVIIPRSKDPEERFTRIFSGGFWRSKESVSGEGSTLRYTANLREKLKGVLDQHGVRTILDAPCGDFHWMRHFLAERATKYVGGDIVRPLIEQVRAKHAGPGVDFVHLDIVKDPLPCADLMLCRDCLFHLSYADIRAALCNFVASGIPLLLTTTHGGEVHNHDIITGSFRKIDLFAAPFNFSRDVSCRIVDWLPPDPERFMCLWTREQVVDALAIWHD